ncbi:hypothetical protein VNO77_19384 [Canavalia gladiata]|uniref:Uncharacterized protein n=1 Tax=Canavalia gladiata TaxID=3824 RepID=A0AAN9LSG9_CANGL
MGHLTLYHGLWCMYQGNSASAGQRWSDITSSQLEWNEKFTFQEGLMLLEVTNEVPGASRQVEPQAVKEPSIESSLKLRSCGAPKQYWSHAEFPPHFLQLLLGQIKRRREDSGFGDRKGGVLSVQDFQSHEKRGVCSLEMVEAWSIQAWKRSWPLHRMVFKL